MGTATMYHKYNTTIFGRWPVYLSLGIFLTAVTTVVAVIVAGSHLSSGLSVCAGALTAMVVIAIWWTFAFSGRGGTSPQLVRLSALVDSVPDGIIMIDEHGVIELFNAAGRRMFGYEDEDLAGRSINLLVPPPHEKLHDGYLARFLAGGESRIMDLRREVEGFRKDGSIFPVDLRVSKLKVDNRRVFAGIVSDITERKRFEAQLEEAKVAAEAANRTKSVFLANMSHEIRTPMTAIMGFADNLQEPDLSEEDRLAAVHTIRRNGYHLLRLIDDILELSKIEAGGLVMEQTQYSPAELLVEVHRLMEVNANAKGLTLGVEYDGLLPETIQTDPTRLRQVLLNVVGNGIKFTENGGVQVMVRFFPSEDRPLIQFEITDTGIGMSQRQLGRLFQPFFQSDSSTTRSFGGTGLGLTISRRLTEFLGGQLALESQPGQGTVVRVTVPSPHFSPLG